MQPTRDLISELFAELNGRIEGIDRERRSNGLLPVSKASVRLLGQVSLLSNERASAMLSLAQTGDVDAFLVMDHVVKEALTSLLLERGLIYDEDSYLIWIPPGTKFELLFNYKHLIVESIDPESALVSKAVKAPEKNRQLIREAIASNGFPKLVNRILENGGRLEDFA